MTEFYEENINDDAYPFETVEDAWFWFIDANQARIDGAQITAGHGLLPRPCEPNDILIILNRLYKNRRLKIEHFRVMRFYGVRGMAPDPYRPKEISASKLWDEAMEMLEEILIAKGVVDGSIDENSMKEPIWCNYNNVNNGGCEYA